jgi:hypothetical protein
MALRLLIISLFTCLFQINYCQIQGTFYEKGLELKSPFTIRQYSTKDGLPQSQVIKILKRKDGSLILSTGANPVFFDGYSMEPVTPPGTMDFIIYDRIWYTPSTDQLFGINISDGKFMQLYPVFKILNRSAPFLTLHQFGDSLVVFGDTVNFTFNLKTQQSSALRRLSGFIDSDKDFNINNLLYFDGKYYKTRVDGLYAYSPSTGKVTLEDKRFFRLLKSDPYHHRLVGVTDDELVDVTHDSTLRHIPKLGFQLEPLSMDFRSDEEIVVGTNKGLYIFYPDFDEVYKREDGLPSEYCYSMLYDTTMSRLYLGTGERGLVSLQFKTNYSFSQRQGVVSCNSLIRTTEGKILFLNGDNTICRLKIDTSEVYIREKGLWASLSEIDGKLFAGTWGHGVRIFKEGKLIDSLIPEQIGGRKVSACLKTKDNRIWIGTDKGLAVGTTVKNIRPAKAKIIGDIITLFELKDGTLCVGTTKGAYFLKGDKIIWRYTNKEGFIAREVRCFYEDPMGRVWIGMYRGGLIVKDGNKITSITSLPNCMLNQDLFCLALDAEGYLYITSNQGLWRISQQDLFDFYERKLDYLIPFFYGNEEGILNTEFNGGFQNKFIRTPGNHFYFPSIEGIVMTVPEILSESSLMPKINKVLVNDTLFNKEVHIFSRSTFAIEFRYSTTNLSEKDNVFFQYKLINGEKTDWSKLQKSLSVSYKLLPPGEYTFVVRAVNGFNNPHPNEVSYAFVIEPSLTQTALFRWSVILLIFGGLVAAINFRNRNLRAKDREKELYARRVAEIELKAIQAQLNPHFIFNCLNSIKSLILLKDLERANQSLNTFARLTRQMLENSDKIFISFEEKIAFLKGYIELEKLRFGDQFSYELSWSDDVLPSYQIPHLLLQPYVENAIKHGLAHLDGRDGLLTIRFFMQDANVVCKIIDNGIGRDLSRKINELRHMHNPKGTGLTLEKKEFLKKHIDYNCTIDILDLWENGMPKGTEVTVVMPIYYEGRNN